jgi:hypothetical protein
MFVFYSHLISEPQFLVKERIPREISPVKTLTNFGQTFRHFEDYIKLPLGQYTFLYTINADKI